MSSNGKAAEEIAKAPKAELHVHLEGSISVPTLNRLASKKGLPPFKQTPYRFSNFREFDDLFPFLGQYFDTPEDFYEIAVAFGRRLAEENIVYCEVSIMPYVHVRRGIEFRALMEAISAAFGELEQESGIQVRIICAIPRALGEEPGYKTLDWIDRYGGDKIVGIDLAGAEEPNTIEPFVGVFEQARALGLGTVAHAGEFLGPEFIWQTIEKLKPTRIGHGVSAFQDKELMKFLAYHGIPLDISVTSNVRLGAVKALALHPARAFYEAGVPCTINTDDPAFFDTTLINEYFILAEQFGFKNEEIKGIMLNGFRYGLGHCSG